MQAGNLRHVIRIQARDPGQDAYGAPKNTWGREFAGVRAEVKELAGRELQAAQQINASISHQVTIRYLRGVNNQQRVIFEDRVLDIHAVLNPDGRKVWMELFCEEHQGVTIF